jgi:hypothetical protein
MKTNASDLLRRAAHHAGIYLASVADRPVGATATSRDLLGQLGGDLAESGDDPGVVIDDLARAAAMGTVASQGPRYFGFVVGGSLPVATAADWLVSAWDQNAGIHVLSPLAAVAEEVAARWIRGIAGLDDEWSAGFVTGCQMANFTALAAARHHVLRTVGWDVEERGLFDAPPIEVVVSDESHYTIFTALRLLGLGAGRVRLVPTDEQGRMRADEAARILRDGNGPCIVCAQAGNVNTGAFDPIPEIADAAAKRGAWLHVDGAFGLWAAASPSLAPLVHGIDRADSIATDAHKWLNVPYDSRVAPARDDAGRVLHSCDRDGARPARVRPRGVASRPRRTGLRRPAHARPQRAPGSRRALLRPRTPNGGGARRAPLGEGAQRRRAQPAARSHPPAWHA